MMDEVPAPGWFAEHRTRVLGMWVALGVFGSASVWAAQWLTTDDVVFGGLSAAGVVVGVLLVVAVITDWPWMVRKGAGAALLLHLSRLAALGWQSVLDEPSAAGYLSLAGTGAVVTVLALQAGWLHWVAGLANHDG